MESKLLGSDQEQRLTPLLLFSCTVAISGALLQGYELGVSGGVTSMDSFLKEFFPDDTETKEDRKISNYCKFNSQKLSMFTSLLSIAGLFASLAASHVTNRRGRLFSMRFGGVFFLAGAFLGGLAINMYMLYLSRIFLGIGVGFTRQSIALYLAEQAPANYRGAIFSFFSVSQTGGSLLAHVANYVSQKIEAGWVWRLPLGLAAFPAAIFAAGTLFIPDTPTSFIQRGGDPREASRLLQKIRGTTDIRKEFSELTAAATKAPTSAGALHPLRRIARREYRPMLVVALAISFFKHFAGTSFVGLYAPLLFRIIGLSGSNSLLSTLMMKMTSTVTTLAALPLVDRLGRRAFFFLGGALMLFSLVAAGGIMMWKLGDHGTLSEEHARLLVAVFFIFVCANSCSWGPFPTLLASEIFPLEIRTAGKSIVVAMDFFWSFVSAQSMLWMLCQLKWGVFFLFAGCVMAMTLLVFFFLPETKGLQLEQIGKVWREHWYWKRFVENEAEEGLMSRYEQRGE